MSDGIEDRTDDLVDILQPWKGVGTWSFKAVLEFFGRKGGKRIVNGVIDDSLDNYRRNNRERTQDNRRYRQGRTGANRNDRQQVDAVAREHNIDRMEFGDFVEKVISNTGRGGSDNFSMPELRRLAEEFKENNK